MTSQSPSWSNGPAAFIMRELAEKSRSQPDVSVPPGPLAGEAMLFAPLGYQHVMTPGKVTDPASAFRHSIAVDSDYGAMASDGEDLLLEKKQRRKKRRPVSDIGEMKGEGITHKKKKKKPKPLVTEQRTTQSDDEILDKPHQNRSVPTLLHTNEDLDALRTPARARPKSMMVESLSSPLSPSPGNSSDKKVRYFDTVVEIIKRRVLVEEIYSDSELLYSDDDQSPRSGKGKPSTRQSVSPPKKQLLGFQRATVTKTNIREDVATATSVTVNVNNSQPSPSKPVTSNQLKSPVSKTAASDIRQSSAPRTSESDDSARMEPDGETQQVFPVVKKVLGWKQANVTTTEIREDIITQNSPKKVDVTRDANANVVPASDNSPSSIPDDENNAQMPENLQQKSNNNKVITYENIKEEKRYTVQTVEFELNSQSVHTASTGDDVSSLHGCDTIGSEISSIADHIHDADSAIDEDAGRSPSPESLPLDSSSEKNDLEINVSGSGVNVRPTDISLSFEHNTGTQPPQSHRADDSGNRKPNEFNIIRVVPRRPSPSPTESKSLSLDVNNQPLSPSSGYVSDASIGLSTPGTPATDFNDYVSKADIKPVLPTDNKTEPKLIKNGKLIEMQLNIAADEATVVKNCSDPFETVRNSGQPVPGDKIVSNALQSVPVVEYSPILNALLPEDQQTGNLTRTDPSTVQLGGVAYNSVEIADTTSAKPVKSASVQLGVGATESASHDQSQPIKMLQTTGQPILTETNMSSALQSVPVVQYSPVLNALQPDKENRSTATESITLAEPSDVQQKALVCNTPLSESHLDIVSGEFTPQENDSKSFEKLQNGSQSALRERDLSQALQSIPVVEFSPVHEALQPEGQPAIATSSATLAEPVAHLAKPFMCNTPLAETQLDVTAGVAATHDHTEPVEIVRNSSQLANGVSDIATALQSVPVVEYSPALNALQPDHIHTGSLTVTLTDPTTAQHGVTSNYIEIADAASAKPVKSASVQLGVGATETASHDHAQPVEMLQTTGQPTSTEADMSNALQSVPVVQYSPVLNALQPEDQPDKQVAMGSITLTEPSTIQPKAVVCNTPLSATQLDTAAVEVTVDGNNSASIETLSTKPTPGETNLKKALQSVPVVEYSPALNALQPEEQQTGNVTLTDPSTVRPDDVAYNVIDIADATSVKPVKSASVQLGVGATETASHDHAQPVEMLRTTGQPTSTETDMSNALQSVPVVQYSPVLDALQSEDQPDKQVAMGSITLTEPSTVQPKTIVCNTPLSATQMNNVAGEATLQDSDAVTFDKLNQPVKAANNLANAMQSVPVVEYSPVLNALQSDHLEPGNSRLAEATTVQPHDVAYSAAEMADTSSAKLIKNASVQLGLAEAEAADHDHSEPVDKLQGGHPTAVDSKLSKALQSVPVVEYSPVLNALQPKEQLSAGSLTLTDSTTVQPGDIASNAVEITAASSAKPVKTASLMQPNVDSHEITVMNSEPFDIVHERSQPMPGEHSLSTALQSVPTVEFSPVLNALQPEDEGQDQGFVVTDSITLTNSAAIQSKAVVCNTPLAEAHLDVAVDHATPHESSEPVEIVRNSSQLANGVSDMATALQSVPVVEYSPALNALQPNHLHTGSLTVTLTDPTTAPPCVTSNYIEIADAASAKPVKSASVQLGVGATETASHDHAQPVEMLQTTGQPTSTETDMSNALQSVPVVQYSPVLNALQPEDQPDKQVAMGSITLTEPSTVQPKAVVCNTPLSATQIETAAVEVTVDGNNSASIETLSTKPTPGETNLKKALQSVPVVEYSPALNALQPEEQQAGNVTLTDPSTVRPDDVAYNVIDIADATSVKPVKSASVQLGVGSIESASHDHAVPVEILSNKGQPVGSSAEIDMSKALQSIPVVEYSPVLNALQPDSENSVVAHDLTVADAKSFQPEAVECNVTNAPKSSLIDSAKTALNVEVEIEIKDLELARPSSASDLDKQTGGDAVDNLARSDNNDKSCNDDDNGNEINAVGGKAEAVSVCDIVSEQTRIIEVEICQLEIATPIPNKNLVVVAEDGLNKLTDVANDGNLSPEENGLTKPHVNSEIVQLELAGEDGQHEDKDEDNKSLEDSVAAYTSSSDVDGKENASTEEELVVYSEVWQLEIARTNGEDSSNNKLTQGDDGQDITPLIGDSDVINSHKHTHQDGNNLPNDKNEDGFAAASAVPTSTSPATSDDDLTKDNKGKNEILNKHAHDNPEVETKNDMSVGTSLSDNAENVLELELELTEDASELFESSSWVKHLDKIDNSDNGANGNIDSGLGKATHIHTADDANNNAEDEILLAEDETPLADLELSEGASEELPPVTWHKHHKTPENDNNGNNQAKNLGKSLPMTDDKVHEDQAEAGEASGWLKHPDKTNNSDNEVNGLAAKGSGGPLAGDNATDLHNDGSKSKDVETGETSANNNNEAGKSLPAAGHKDSETGEGLNEEEGEVGQASSWLKLPEHGDGTDDDVIDQVDNLSNSLPGDDAKHGDKNTHDNKGKQEDDLNQPTHVQDHEKVGDDESKLNNNRVAGADSGENKIHPAVAALNDSVPVEKEALTGDESEIGETSSWLKHPKYPDGSERGGSEDATTPAGSGHGSHGGKNPEHDEEWKEDSGEVGETSTWLKHPDKVDKSCEDTAGFTDSIDQSLGKALPSKGGHDDKVSADQEHLNEKQADNELGKTLLVAEFHKDKDVINEDKVLEDQGEISEASSWLKQPEKSDNHADDSNRFIEDNNLLGKALSGSDKTNDNLTEDQGEVGDASSSLEHPDKSDTDDTSKPDQQQSDHGLGRAHPHGSTDGEKDAVLGDDDKLHEDEGELGQTSSWLKYPETGELLADSSLNKVSRGSDTDGGKGKPIGDEKDLREDEGELGQASSWLKHPEQTGDNDGADVTSGLSKASPASDVPRSPAADEGLREDEGELGEASAWLKHPEMAISDRNNDDLTDHADSGLGKVLPAGRNVSVEDESSREDVGEMTEVSNWIEYPPEPVKYDDKTNENEQANGLGKSLPAPAAPAAGGDGNNDTSPVSDEKWREDCGELAQTSSWVEYPNKFNNRELSDSHVTDGLSKTGRRPQTLPYVAEAALSFDVETRTYTFILYTAEEYARHRAKEVRELEARRQQLARRSRATCTVHMTEFSPDLPTDCFQALAKAK